MLGSVSFMHCLLTLSRGEGPLGRGVHFLKRQAALRRDAAARFVLRAKWTEPSSNRPSLPSTGPQAVATCRTSRGSTCRAVGQRRMPKVPVSRKTIASIAAMVSGRQRIESFMPGRFFFIWMAVV